MPDVDDAQFDLQDEMTFMSGLPQSGTPGGGASRRKTETTAADDDGGAEYPAIDEEEPKPQGLGTTEAAVEAAAMALTAVSELDNLNEINGGASAPEAVMSDLQIDPALAALMPAVESTPASKKKPKKPRKKGKKDVVAATQDTIEDVDPSQTETKAEGEIAPVDNDEIDVEEFRKKKTPSKFQAASTGEEVGAAAVAEQQGELDGGIDDMDDLPARVAKLA